MRLTVSPEAIEDLNEIWAYIAARNLSAADRLINSIEYKFELLCDFPFMGSLRSELGPNVRGIPMGNYIMLYEVADTDITILRVIHARRNVEREFKGD